MCPGTAQAQPGRTAADLHTELRSEEKKLFSQLRRVIRARARFEEAWRSEIEAHGIKYERYEGD